MGTFALALLAAVGGLALVAAGLRSRRVAPDATSYLHDLESDDAAAAHVDEFAAALKQPFLVRALHPLAGGAADALSRLTPRAHVERLHRQVLLAGATGTVRAEEVVVLQVLACAFSLLAAVGVLAVVNPSPGKALLILALFPTAGALMPMVWLRRKADQRQEAIFRDLPDALDLLAISVEAGVGFEAAMDVVCSHFVSPLADEFSRTLKEMELGLSRKEALHNLKRRTEVPELSNFVLALTQADALGMPIGRVLHTQAHELRNKRRQWAREKAAKLPVKILFPLIFFIFPAVLVVILGPAMATTITGLG